MGNNGKLTLITTTELTSPLELLVGYLKSLCAPVLAAVLPTNLACAIRVADAFATNLTIDVHTRTLLVDAIALVFMVLLPSGKRRVRPRPERGIPVVVLPSIMNGLGGLEMMHWPERVREVHDALLKRTVGLASSPVHQPVRL